MNQRLKFFLISLLYIPLSTLGWVLGSVFHRIYIFMINFTPFELPKWVVDGGTFLIPLFVASWVASLLFGKLTNKVYSNVLIVTPVIFHILALIASLFAHNQKSFVQNIILLISFIYFLKKECPNRLPV